MSGQEGLCQSLKTGQVLRSQMFTKPLWADLQAVLQQETM